AAEGAHGSGASFGKEERQPPGPPFPGRPDPASGGARSRRGRIGLRRGSAPGGGPRASRTAAPATVFVEHRRRPPRPRSARSRRRLRSRQRGQSVLAGGGSEAERVPRGLLSGRGDAHTDRTPAAEREPHE